MKKNVQKIVNLLLYFFAFCSDTLQDILDTSRFETEESTNKTLFYLDREKKTNKNLSQFWAWSSASIINQMMQIGQNDFLQIFFNSLFIFDYRSIMQWEQITRAFLLSKTFDSLLYVLLEKVFFIVYYQHICRDLDRI